MATGTRTTPTWAFRRLILEAQLHGLQPLLLSELLLREPTPRTLASTNDPVASLAIRQTPPMRDEKGGTGRRRAAGAVAIVAGLLVAASVGVWVGQTLLAPPAPLPPGREYAVVAVRDGELERTLPLNVAARWSGGTRVVNDAVGRLTQLRARDGSPVKPGAVLYTVDLQPTVLATGRVPAFRTMQPGIKGPDVSQLQALLADFGYRTSGPDGVYGSGTASQVRSWQRALKVPATGIVELGRVTFVPRLPAVLAWNEDAAVGATLGGGETLAHLLPPTPRFTMTIPPNQLTLVRPGMPVTITVDDTTTWQARIGDIAEPADDGSAAATLVPAAGASSVCDTACSKIPLAGSGAIPSTVTVVVRQQGPILPAAALAVGTDGNASVVREDGSRVPVTVRAASGGQVLVSGVRPGDRVRVSEQPAR